MASTVSPHHQLRQCASQADRAFGLRVPHLRPSAYTQAACVVSVKGCHITGVHMVGGIHGVWQCRIAVARVALAHALTDEI